MSEGPLRCFVAGMQHESSSFSPIPTGDHRFTGCAGGSISGPRPWDSGYGESCQVAIDLGFELVALFSCRRNRRCRRHTRCGANCATRWSTNCAVRALFIYRAGRASTAPRCRTSRTTARVSCCRSCVRWSVTTWRSDAAPTSTPNVSSRMLDAADIVVSCREYPHTDYRQRAEEMLPVLAGIRRGEAQPTTAAVRFMAPGAYPTTEEPV